MTGKPVLAASARANVLFPDPIIPSTRMRRPIVRGAPFMEQNGPDGPNSWPGRRAPRCGHSGSPVSARLVSPRADHREGNPWYVHDASAGIEIASARSPTEEPLRTAKLH